MEKIIIFDTTLRDGEQSPGASLNKEEKLTIAKQLVKLGVNVIEAGFPAASSGDFEAVKQIAEEIKEPVIAALSRATQKDIDIAGQALKKSLNPRIHTFIATSDIHIMRKFQKSRNEILQEAIWAVEHARKYVDNVEFSAEDAFRSDRNYLCKVITEVINAGATTVNIPDTVGYAIPWEFGEVISYIFANVPNIHKAILSVHCHNDLGLATANSLAAIKAGARQIECTVNGLGERAGNAALEEIVMAIELRKSLFEIDTDINTREIIRTSQMVSNLTGIAVQKNKAIVGENAFAHEAGIHQDGILKDRQTYEIMMPETVGLKESNLVLGKHSGRHALRKKIEDFGYNLNEEKINEVFAKFKDLADKKKEIFDEDIHLLIEETLNFIPEVFQYISRHLDSADGFHSAKITLHHIGGQTIEGCASGNNGPIDATLKAIDKATSIPGILIDFSITSSSQGRDSLATAQIMANFNGEKPTVGRASDIDTITAAAKAYLQALNKYLYLTEKAFSE